MADNAVKRFAREDHPVSEGRDRAEKSSSTPDDRTTLSQALDGLDDVLSSCHSNMEELQKRLGPILAEDRESDNGVTSPGREPVSDLGGRIDRVVRSLETFRYQLQLTTRRVDL